MQVSLEPNVITPQLLHVLICDLYELKPINTRSNNKIGIRNRSRKIFPRKLNKKLIPKTGIIINTIKAQVSKFLLALRK